jgi:hypothetical protein
MGSGAVYLKMIAQYCSVKKSQPFTKLHKKLLKKKSPALKELRGISYLETN